MENPAIAVAHWPGKDTYCCAEHLEKLKQLAAFMGFPLSVTLLFGDLDAKCANCENEKPNAAALANGV